MSGKSRFIRPFDRQDGKWCKTLLRSAKKEPLSYLLVTVKAIELEKSFLFTWKYLGLFDSTWTADVK